MSFLLGIVIFVIALLLSIMLHELGHFVTAKRFGMKVTQFFVGFGQTIWSTVRGETEYGVKAIPAGGFVKIVGMTTLEEVDEQDEPRSFRRQPGWQQFRSREGRHWRAGQRLHRRSRRNTNRRRRPRPALWFRHCRPL